MRSDGERWRRRLRQEGALWNITVSGERRREATHHNACRTHHRYEQHPRTQHIGHRFTITEKPFENHSRLPDRLINTITSTSRQVGGLLKPTLGEYRRSSWRQLGRCDTRSIAIVTNTKLRRVTTAMKLCIRELYYWDLFCCCCCCRDHYTVPITPAWISLSFLLLGSSSIANVCVSFGSSDFVLLAGTIHSVFRAQISSFVATPPVRLRVLHPSQSYVPPTFEPAWPTSPLLSNRWFFTGLFSSPFISIEQSLFDGGRVLLLHAHAAFVIRFSISVSANTCIKARVKRSTSLYYLVPFLSINLSSWTMMYRAFLF